MTRDSLLGELGQRRHGRLRVLVAISHPGVATSLMDVLALEPDVEVARVPSLPQTTSVVERWAPDVILADAAVAKRLPAQLAPRVLVTASGDGSLARQTAEAIGAAGWHYVDEVASAIARVRTAPAPRELAARVVEADAKLWALGLAALAALMRALYLTIGTDDPAFTGWYTDSYHHWQIAYLTKEIGIFSGPRLWDFGGMEYFWGLVPTLLGALMLAVTFSTAFWPIQLMNVAAGSAIVGVLYLVGRRHWSHRVGLVVATAFAVNPVSVFTDTSGMQEPVALLLLALALYWFSERPLLAGLMLGLAAASRADYWAITLAILASSALALRCVRLRPPAIRLGPIAPYLVGYLIPLTPYVLHLWIQTGNPIYPIYWNFLGNARGDWLADVQPTPVQLAVQLLARVGLVAAAIAHVAVIVKRPRGWPVLVAGLWGTSLILVMLGLTRYVLNYRHEFWIDRLMLLLYLLGAVLVALLLVGLEQRLGLRRLALGTALGLGAAFSLNALWLPTTALRDTIRPGYERSLGFGREVAEVAREGTVIVPGTSVFFTYALVQNGVGAKRLLSDRYHPEYSPEVPDEFLEWLRRHDVRWLAFIPGDPFYERVVRSEPARFRLVRQDLLHLYEVRP